MFYFLFDLPSYRSKDGWFFLLPVEGWNVFSGSVALGASTGTLDGEAKQYVDHNLVSDRAFGLRNVAFGDCFDSYVRTCSNGLRTTIMNYGH